MRFCEAHEISHRRAGEALINPTSWKNKNSRKFSVDSVPPSSAARAQEWPGGTVLGSKRGDQVAFVAPLCIKALRLVTLQLPEKFSPIGPGLDRTSRLRRSRKFSNQSSS